VINLDLHSAEFISRIHAVWRMYAQIGLIPTSIVLNSCLLLSMASNDVRSTLLRIHLIGSHTTQMFWSFGITFVTVRGAIKVFHSSKCRNVNTHVTYNIRLPNFLVSWQTIYLIAKLLTFPESAHGLNI
jgi:hypothetical protein